MFYLRLLALVIISPLMTVVIYIFGKKTVIKKVGLGRREIIAGVVFSFGSILLTHLSIPVGGALISTRDSAVLSAALIFGPIAGMIAAVVSALERFFSAGATFTALGASITTVIAGVGGSLLRHFMFDDRKPSPTYGFMIAFCMEVVNMLFVFLTNMSDIKAAFNLVESVGLAMILSNSISTALSLLIVSNVLGNRKALVERRKRNTLLLSQVFARWLFVSVIFSFVISCGFIYVLETRLSSSDAEEMISLYINDVSQDISDASDENLLELTKAVRDELEVTNDYSRNALIALCDKYDISEINIIDSNGIIRWSSTLIYIGFNMRSGEQSRAFIEALIEGDAEYYVQSYQTVSHKSGVNMKYAAYNLDGTGFVQVGYNADRFQRDIDSAVVGITRNRHVGESGFMLIANEDDILVSDPDKNEGKHLNVTGIEIGECEENTLLRMSVYGTEAYVMYSISEGYYIIGVLPLEEVLFGRNISLYVTIFIEIMVFAMLFLLIYFLVKKLVVENIQKINASLEEITGGNLNVSVNVRTNREFVSLSDDINSTVDTLKGYIKEAAERIDKELEFARTIQLGCLPSVFPPYPDRKDFDIYALMSTAKEVGGDFYDFYLLDENRLVFLIADVSGKGISGAMFMMRAKTVLKSYMENEKNTALAMTKANNALSENNEAEMFVTCWMGILDFTTHIVHYTNAGHNPPLVRHKGGDWEYLRMKPGFVLAGLENYKYREGEFELAPGDEIYLYTDGVTEATDSGNNLYGEDRLLAAIKKTDGMSAREVCQSIKGDVDLFVGDASQSDDITMLSLIINENNSITLDPNEDNMNDVVAFVEGVLEKAEVPPKIMMKIDIVIDEIYSNIKLYSGATEARVECTVRDNNITLIFSDNGVPYNPLEAEEPDVTLDAEKRKIGGLGIFMVKKTMDEVDYEYELSFNRLILKKSF